MTNPETSGGFQADSYGVWPPSGASSANNSGDPAQDFNGMTWKQIQAVIRGGGSIVAGHEAQAKSYVDPATLVTAANRFHSAEMNLRAISGALKAQTLALAGPDGSWSGDAANNFRNLMDTMVAKIDGMVARISDGDSGARHVPNQLVNAAANLQWAQDTLANIDAYYAQQVLAQGSVFPDGRARISDFPEAVQMMTNDMRGVATLLAQSYSTFAVAPYTPAKPPPPPPGSGSGDPPPNPGGGNPPPPPGVDPPPNPDVGDPPPNPDVGNPPPPAGGGPNPVGSPDFKNFTATPPPSPDQGGGTPGLDDPAFTSADVAPFQGADLPEGITAEEVPDTPDFTPAQFGGLPGTPGGGTPGFSSPTLPKPGDAGKFSNASVKPPSGSSVSPGSFESAELPGGLPGAAKPTDFAGVAPVDSSEVAGFGKPGSSPAAGSGAPMMPPGAGGGAAQSSAAERPDSAGLLSGVDKPWESGLPEGLGDPAVGGEALPLESADWATPQNAATGPGAPMMPPGTGGGAAQNSAAERPDSAGLLSGVDKPWESGLPEGLGDPAEAGADRVAEATPWAQAGAEQQVVPGGVPVLPPATPPATEKRQATEGQDPHERVLVPLVQVPAVTDDVSAWDVGAENFLQSPASHKPEPAVVPGLVAAPVMSTFKRVRQADAERVEEMVFSCADGPEPEPRPEPEPEPEEPADGEAEEERTMASFLSQDTSAWGRGPATSPGLIE